jgi:hypothetical protein
MVGYKARQISLYGTSRARDYLVIPDSEIDIKSLFNIGRDILDLRRLSMSIETLRVLVLCKVTQLKVRDEVKEQ